MTEPKIRFRADDGSAFPDWEEMTLSAIFTERAETSVISDDAPLLSFTIEQGVINPEDKKSNKRDFLMKDKDSKKFAVTELDDIIYNPANLKFGAIHRNKLGRGVVSPIYAIFHTEQNPVFMECVVRNPAFIKKSLTFLEGTVEKLKTLKPRDFLRMKVFIPSLPEQQKIADFLSNVDEVIAASEEEVANLEKQKKAVMQKIFSQEVRFKKEDGSDFPDWEDKAFSEITYSAGKKNKDNLPLESYAITNTHGFIPQNEAHDDFGYMQNTDRRAYNVVISNSFGYNPARINVGSLGYYSGEDDVIVSSLYEVFRTTDNVADEFLVQWFKTAIFQKWIEKLQEGSVRQYFYYDKLRECHINLPCLEEQQLIADFLTNYDDAITAAKQELEKRKELKKGLLQQMFV